MLLFNGIGVKKVCGDEFGIFIAAHGSAGVLPNLLFCTGAPFLPLVSPGKVQFRQFVFLALWVSVAMAIYEVTQIWEPTRVFDWADIWASAVGGILAIGIGWLFFFRPQWRSENDGKAYKGASPNDGPATPDGNPRVTDGPSSVS